jgi:hypothetical protein
MDPSYGGDTAVKVPDKTPPESVDEQNADEAQILVDKKELPPGTKKGDKCMFEVMEDHGEEMSLRYVKEGESAKTESTPGEDTASELAALDSQGTE